MAEKIPEIYTDGVSNAHWVSSMVKLDFVTHTPSEPNEKPKAEPAVRIVMSPPALLNLADSVNALIEKLVEAGIFQKPQK